MRYLLIASALLVAGCATTIQKAAQTVAVTARVQIDVEDAVEAIDLQTKQALVAKVKAGLMTVAQATAENDAWEAKLAKVVKANRVLRDALKTASHVVDASNAANSKDYQGAVNDVTSALATLLQTLTDAGIHIKGVN